TVTINAPQNEAPTSTTELSRQGDQCWSLRAARELDDAILHLRLNEPEIGIIQFKTTGDANKMMSHDAFLLEHKNHWLVQEILLHWARVLQRIDLTSRSLVALIEPGSCFAGTLAEVAFACDRIFMADGEFEDLPGEEASLTLSAVSFGHYPMPNARTRLQTRLPGEADLLEAIEARQGKALLASEADELGLVSNAYDDIDWYDEIRIFLEERASFSADALTAMEANLRFGGP
ncbi:MAG: benzoyl-CoA-dihydrodiol lyase, partial [Aestuariibacter sp.]|nr:benzoyl-CoA-dihydrodiol lyase [Aestuariibacter sp.]